MIILNNRARMFHFQCFIQGKLKGLKSDHSPITVLRTECFIGRKAKVFWFWTMDEACTVLDHSYDQEPSAPVVVFTATKH